MAKLFQVGVGSGGMPVLDALARDPRISHVAIIDPDTYQEHNVERHVFDRDGIGKAKTELAAQWLRNRLNDLQFELFKWDICDPHHASEMASLAKSCDIGVCAADN